MDADKLKAAIAKLTGSTVAAKLRQVMPEIDEKVEQGVQHEDIVAALREGGIEVNIETFRKNLYRYRAKLRAAGGNARRANQPSRRTAICRPGGLRARRPSHRRKPTRFPRRRRSRRASRMRWTSANATSSAKPT
ncbi:MAG: hypothetical protein V3Q69_13870 (plasmid) [Burkholderia sp.]